MLPLTLGPLRGDESDEELGPTTTHYVTMAGRRRNVPIYAVRYDNMWTAVVIRPTSNKFKLATCCQHSCKSRPWGCIHAKAVNKITRVDAESVAVRAEMDREDGLPLGPDGVLDAVVPRAPAPGTAPRPAAATPIPKPDKPSQQRRARNMFPCAAEVALCDAYSAAVDRLRDSGSFRRLDHVHVEPECLVCGLPSRGRDVLSWKADLYTIRGRLEVVVGAWTCSSGHLVEYDGAEDGLFAAGPETVYARVFLDAVLGVCVIARSTMAAASEYLTSALRNTGAYADGEDGQARQQVSKAVGEFTETLIVPDVAFQCGDCGVNEADGGRFNCILEDGQILAVLQDYIKPMLRPGMDAPRADMAITYACGVRNATVRAVIRHRVRSSATDTVAVTADEVLKFRSFAAVLSEAPPAPPPAPTEESRGVRTREQHEKALLWASATHFHEFFFVRNLHCPTAVAATAGAAGDTDGEEQSDGSEAGSFVDWVSDGDGGDQRASAGSSSEYSSGVLEYSVCESTSGSTEEDTPSIEGERATEEGSADDGHLLPDSAVGGAVDERIALGLGVQMMALEALAQVLPVSPPPSGDGLEFLLSQPGGTDGAAEEQCVPESVNAAGPKTKDCWRVPLSSVEQTEAVVDVNSDNPVAIDDADPASPLTQRAVCATLAAIKRRRTGNLFTIVQVGKLPIAFKEIERLTPYNWLNDEC